MGILESFLVVIVVVALVIAVVALVLENCTLMTRMTMQTQT